jgi:hypothetical protein
MTSNTRTFNLSKAQKYLDKLANFVSNNTSRKVRRTRSNPLNQNISPYVSVDEISQLVQNEEELRTRYEEQVNKVLKNLKTKLNVLHDYKNFKNMVYDTNSKVGLSNVLTKIDLLEEEKNIYESIQNSIQMQTLSGVDKLPDIYKKLVDSSKSYTSREESVDRIKLSVFNNDDITKKLKQIYQELESMENKRDKLNAITDITFEFHPETLELLGL